MRSPDDIYIRPSELQNAFDAFELLGQKGEVEKYEIFRDSMSDPTQNIHMPNILFCRVVLTNGEIYHCPVYETDDMTELCGEVLMTGGYDHVACVLPKGHEGECKPSKQGQQAINRASDIWLGEHEDRHGY